MGKLALAVARQDVVNILEDWKLEWKKTDCALKANYNDETEDDMTVLMGEASRKIFNLPTFLLDRPDCETNPDFLQLLPYAVFVAREDETEFPNGKILVYQRGKSGDENRLHNLYSIGIGGHVEESPTDNKDLLSVLADNLIREIDEELHIDLDMLAKNNHMSAEEYVTRLKVGMMENAFFLYHSNPVGSAHLGIGIVLAVNNSLLETAVGENDVINNLQLMDYFSKFRPLACDENGYSHLEGWSFLCYRVIEKNVTQYFPRKYKAVK